MYGGLPPLGETMRVAEIVVNVGLNSLGYIPIVGTYSAIGLRVPLAVVELIAGVGLGALAVGSYANGLGNNGLGGTATKLMKEGCLNLARTAFEIVPFVSLGTCLPYDIFKNVILAH
ncbi:MAG: hypothetical protein K940chlam3_01521 [Chlamydiae bacterium]|nr:hypothetical protein [Chlamydiota bacterium]